MNKVIIYQSKFYGNKKRVDFKKKELYFTEKFALLNLLNTLARLAPQQNGGGEPPSSDPSGNGGAQYNGVYGTPPPSPSRPENGNAPQSEADSRRANPRQNGAAGFPEQSLRGNMFASVLERHEQISNRIKNRK